MFLDEVPSPDRPFNFVGRASKLKDYRLKIFTAAGYAETREPVDAKDVSLGEYLDSI